MYKIGDTVTMINNDKELIVEIVKINLDGTYEVMKDNGEILRIYREDIKE